MVCKAETSLEGGDEVRGAEDDEAEVVSGGCVVFV